MPQFLYEANFSEAGRKMIGITQPRRVAVTSTAQRVKYEMGSAGGCVGYQVRFDSVNIGPSTCIKYMTDGILLREISHKLLLPDYSVIILDEAHERNINTDVLLGMLSRLGHRCSFSHSKTSRHEHIIGNTGPLPYGNHSRRRRCGDGRS